MTNFSLTVNTDDTAVLVSLIALLGGGSMVSVNASQIIIEDEDDNAPVNTAAPALDATGLPWDERIHAKTKSTNKDGSWKKGRGVTDAQIAQVEAELRARVASPIPNAGNVSPPPVAQPSYPSQPATNVPQVPVQPVNTPVQPPAAPVPASIAPTPQQPAQTPAQPQAFDFGQLMFGLQGAMQSGRLDVTALTALLGEINTAWGTQLVEITDLAQRPDMLDWVKTLLINRGYWATA